MFQPSWDALLRSIDTIANSHHQLSQRIDKDVEGPLRAFQTKREMTNINTIASNLQGMAKELDDAQAQSDKLNKKGGKANVSKVDAATQRLESATQQWESQAPFVFESLQALDEQRINHLRDVLTQLETHEVEQSTRTHASAEAMLNVILEIQTADEIQTFSQRTIQGRPRIERRFTNNNQTRQSSIAGSMSGPLPPVPQQGDSSSAGAQQQAPPQTPPATAGGASAASAAASPIAPQQSARSTTGSSFAAAAPPPAPPSREPTFTEQPPPPPPPEKKLRSRIGTMLSRRRQSIHGGFGQLAPSKNSGPFNRISVSSHGPSISPRASYNNLADTNNRLGSLAENPDSSPAPKDGATNGVGGGPSRTGTASSSGGAAGTGGVGVADISTLNHMTVDEIFGVPPPPGPPPSQQKATGKEPVRDAEGYSVPAAANDPISLAQRDAAAANAGGEQLGEGGDDQAFKVSIQNEPVQDEDPQAKKAALSNVANTLSLGMPTRKGGTVRGRRDVRNTIYVPAPSTVPESSTASTALTALTAGTMPTAADLSSVSRSSTFGSFGSTATPTRPAAVAALASEASLGGGTSDTQSIRSATSLNALAHLKHTDSANPGLNASIIETVTASFEDGEVTAAKINGEIAFSYTAPPASSSSPAAATVTIRINNFPLLEAIGPNRFLVQNTSSPDQFTLDTSHLQHKATAAFTFRAHAENATSLATHCPLVFKPVWKPAGDKLNLLLQYRLNPTSRLAVAGQPVVLRNVVFIATYEGAARNVQTKPPGTHLKDKHLVYWRLAEVTLTEAWSKIVCRVVGEPGGGAVPQPGHLDARWEYAVPASDVTASDNDAGSISISQLLPASNALPEEDEEQDPFADDSLPSPKPTNGAGSGIPSWTDVPLARQIVSGGKYEAK